MKSFLSVFFLVAVLVIGGSPNANAVVLLQEDFESYADDAAIFGTTVGADGGRTGGPWSNGNKEAGSVDGIRLNTDGINVPLTTGQNVKRAPANTGTAADGVGQGRTGHGFTPTTPSVATPLSVKWSFFDNGDHSTVNTGIPIAGLGTVSRVPISGMDLKNSSDNSIMQIGLSPILSVSGPASDVNTFQASINGGTTIFNLAALRPTSPGWTTFELVTTGSTASLYVNGSLTPDANFNNLAVPAPTGGFNYDRLRVGGGTTLQAAFPNGLGVAATVWTGFDNIVVSSIPEPASSLLVLYGVGLVLLGRRRIR